MRLAEGAHKIRLTLICALFFHMETIHQMMQFLIRETIIGSKFCGPSAFVFSRFASLNICFGCRHVVFLKSNSSDEINGDVE